MHAVLATFPSPHRRSGLPTAIALALATFACLPGTARADARDPNLGRVVVTANREAVPADEVLASVTVLDRDDIAASQAPDLLTLLGRQAGVDIARTGGPGQASTVFLRGGNSSHALVLVDGIRVNAATSGILDFAHLPLAQVERIEIVRGPRAALWGSDAIGGVIQVFTRDPSRAFAEAHAGSYETAGASAGGGIARGDARIGLAAGFEGTRGYSATSPDGAFYNPATDADPDGYHNRNLSLRGQVPVGNQLLQGSGLLTDADVEFDAGMGGERTDALNRVFGLRLSGPLAGGRWSHALAAGHSSEDLDTPAFGSRFGSARDSVDWLHTFALDDDNSLSAGVNWSRETGYSREFGSTAFDSSRRNAALFASWRGQAGAHAFEASVRHDDNSQFGGATTGNVGWGWQAAPTLRLRATWGQGFRAPNFNELYYPGFFGSFAGNPDLQPERSTSAELGLAWQPSASQRVELSAYRSRVRDLIVFGGVDFRAENIDRASIDGAELDWHGEFAALTLSANATWQDARDAETGEALLRRAPRKANIAADWRFDNAATLGLDASFVSRRPDFGGDLGGYARVDLRAAAPLSGGWRLEARLENLGDRDYALVNGYETAGRSGSVAIRWDAR
jgi:vitamin B12 transporter